MLALCVMSATMTQMNFLNLLRHAKYRREATVKSELRRYFCLFTAAKREG